MICEQIDFLLPFLICVTQARARNSFSSYKLRLTFLLVCRYLGSITHDAWSFFIVWYNVYNLFYFWLIVRALEIVGIVLCLMELDANAALRFVHALLSPLSVLYSMAILFPRWWHYTPSTPFTPFFLFRNYFPSVFTDSPLFLYLLLRSLSVSTTVPTFFPSIDRVKSINVGYNVYMYRDCRRLYESKLG